MGPWAGSWGPGVVQGVVHGVIIHSCHLLELLSYCMQDLGSQHGLETVIKQRYRAEEMPCLAEIYEPWSDMSLETAKAEGDGHWSFWMWWRAAGCSFPSICVPATTQLSE